MKYCADSFGNKEGMLKGKKYRVYYRPQSKHNDFAELTCYTNDQEPIFAFTEDDGGTVMFGDHFSVDAAYALETDCIRA